MKVLIVEDDMMAARAFARVLKGHGWESKIIGSPEDVDGAQNDFDVILTDWSVGGAEVIQRAVRPVVVCSGTEGLEVPGFTIVKKPADVADIDAALRAAVEENA